ncbi:hypothetical protein PTKU15_80760 [Paraburkholderia terrae]|nr:hypothetical protein PTKU15_80760 [Paraburkholderia terrae]
MYLNVYVPQLRRVGGVVWYLCGYLGQRFASTATGGAQDRQPLLKFRKYRQKPS